MSLDKLRIVSDFPVSRAFIEQVQRTSGSWDSPYKITRYDNHEIGSLLDSRCRIYSSGGIELPRFSVQLNFNREPVCIECTPSGFKHGRADLDLMLDLVLGPSSIPHRFSRIDLKADSQLPVGFFYSSLRLPGKRVSSEFWTSSDLRLDSSSGVTGFQLGAVPSVLKVYDKLLQLRKMKAYTADLPDPLTRVEWQLRRNKCPIQTTGELEKLLKLKPFESLEFFESSLPGDTDSTDRKLKEKSEILNILAREMGLQRAAKMLNLNSHFKRDFSPVLLPREDVREELQASYVKGLERFFENRESSVVLPGK